MTTNRRRYLAGTSLSSALRYLPVCPPVYRSSQINRKMTKKETTLKLTKKPSVMLGFILSRGISFSSYRFLYRVSYRSFHRLFWRFLFRLSFFFCLFILISVFFLCFCSYFCLSLTFILSHSPCFLACL